MLSSEYWRHHCMKIVKDCHVRLQNWKMIASLENAALQCQCSSIISLSFLYDPFVTGVDGMYLLQSCSVENAKYDFKL